MVSLSGNPQKYLCLVYSMVTADRSAVLGVDMTMDGYFKFKKFYEETMKDLKYSQVWVSCVKCLSFGNLTSLLLHSRKIFHYLRFFAGDKTQ